MKVSFSLNQPHNKNNVKFEGYKPDKNQYGKKEYEFNYIYDDSKYDCYVEFFSVEQDKNGNYYTTGILNNSDFHSEGEQGIKLDSGKATKINLSRDYGIRPDEAFAYHYKLYPKNNHYAPPMYALDPGNTINEAMNTNQAYDIYNVVSGKASTVSKGGAMKLIVPDCNNVIWKYDDDNNIVKKSPEEIRALRKSSKNFANKIGGSLAGIEKDLDDGKLDNFSRIITTPLFTDDSLTSHSYWNKNCFQMANSLGNINNYTSLQKKLFAKGKNLVSDGAYVNEGLEGVHFQNVVKWGEESPYYNWFKISGLKDSPLSMGVFGKQLNHVTHRVVNSPYKFVQKDNGTIAIKSQKYDKNKPTYIQIYDDRLVNADNLNSAELIKAYDKFVENHLDINNHNDTVVPYSFKINPETYKENVEKLNAYNKSVPMEKRLPLSSGQGTRAVAQFEHFNLDGKHESGFETWDANPDIAKLNYVYSHADTQELKNIPDQEERADKLKTLKQANMQVQDYAISSAKYWTSKTNEILNLNAAQHLKNLEGKTSDEIYEIIKSQADGKVFPKDLDVTKAIVKAVKRNRYDLKGDNSQLPYNEMVLKGLMDLPLDSIEIGDDIVSTLSSPYISKRAATEDEIGLSRYNLYQKKNPHLDPKYKTAYDLTDKMYTKEMSAFAQNILKSVNDKLPKESKLQDDKGNVTQYGKYVIPILTAQIARFAVIKAVKPDAEYKVDNKTGEISYNYDELKKTSLLEMGIIPDCPEDESVSVIKKLRSGINRITSHDKEALANALYTSIKGTNADSFKLAEMIVNRTQAGLDWRIDATKDIGDIESLKNGKTDFRYTWDQIIKFWSKFADGVKESHPDAYIAAEVTDENMIYDIGAAYKSGSRYSNPKEVVKKLLNEAGFTTTANYSYFSSDITEIFGKLFDFDGDNSPDKGGEKGLKILDKLVGGDDFLHSEPLESLLYTYTFAGNHDKARALDGFAMDMDLVYTDLTENPQYRDRAFRILNGVKYGDYVDPQAVNEFNYNRVSNMTIAKCESIASGMGKARSKINLSPERADYVYNKMVDALKNISNGSFKGQIFETGGFGAKDYNTALDIVLDEMEYLEPDSGEKLSADERKKLKDKSFEMILDPAMSRMLAQSKFLVALLGNPALYAGDEYGSTGFETKMKNIHLQNRNIIHEEWVDPDSPDFKPFVKKYHDYMNDVYSRRTKKELQPLNDGTPVALKPQHAHYTKEVFKDDFNHGDPNNERHHLEGDTNVSALLRQSPNGAMTVSVFNTAALNHQFDRYHSDAELTLNCIDLNEDRGGKVGLKGGLRPGMKFKNIDPGDKNTYYVNGNNQITGPDERPIRFKDATLILYHTPDVQPSFTGRRVMYNPQYNFVSNPYSQVNKQESKVGKNLALISK